jgi:hypothetical protein
VPYRLSEKETAFGVRYRSGSEALYLFRFADNVITEVFETLTEEESNEIDDSTSVSHHWVIIMDHTKHNALYDIIVKEKETKEQACYIYNGANYMNDDAPRKPK